MARRRTKSKKKTSYKEKTVAFCKKKGIKKKSCSVKIGKRHRS